MRKHNGMRPQDIVVLLKIIALGDKKWRMKDLATQLKISPSEISEAMDRNKQAGLVNASKKKIFKNALYDFLVHGIKYVFPTHPGRMVIGIPTAHSAKPLSEVVISKNAYVWQYDKGSIKGQLIEPLYKTVPSIVNQDAKMYELLSLVDAIRVGKAREINLAREQLKNKMYGL